MASDIIDFSDEEGYGKFLDLHEAYDMYINLKQMEVGMKITTVTDVYYVLSYGRKLTISHMC